jgi:Uma2 family endonuclease
MRYTDTMTALATRPITFEEFAAMPEGLARRVLVRGEVIENMPPGGVHGSIAVEMATWLKLWSREHSTGYVGVESGFVLERNPDTVRAPDVSFVQIERIPASGIPEGFWQLAPDLAVEVVSPSESAEDVREKVRDYLRAGTPLVWVIYPRTRELIEHTNDGLARSRSGSDVLENATILPGFSCRVETLFT